MPDSFLVERVSAYHEHGREQEQEQNGDPKPLLVDTPKQCDAKECPGNKGWCGDHDLFGEFDHAGFCRAQDDKNGQYLHSQENKAALPLFSDASQVTLNCWKRAGHRGEAANQTTRKPDSRAGQSASRCIGLAESRAQKHVT